MVANLALLFPGQGSQAIGMAKAASERSAKAKSLIAQADQILGFSLSDLMFNGPEEKLKDTSNTQPALFVASAAALELILERGLQPRWTAGHSLGEYSALYAAGAIDFEQALRLVRARGQAMNAAGSAQPGTMAAILGLDADKVVTVCKEASVQGVCEPANFNSDGQIVISGSVTGVQKAMELATAAGAVKVVPLAVSGAFHSPLMKAAVDAMRPLIQAAPFKRSTVAVITNVDAAETTEAADFQKKLIEQIDHPVRWNETMKKLIALGAETFIEVGSGRVLSTLIKKLDRKKAVYSTDDFENLEKALAAPSTSA